MYTRSLFCFIFAINIDCGYLLEPPHGGGSTVYTINVLSKNKEKYENKSSEINNYTVVKKSQRIA